MKKKLNVGSFKILPLNTIQCKEILKPIQAKWSTNSITMNTSQVYYFRLNTMHFRFLSIVRIRSPVPGLQIKDILRSIYSSLAANVSLSDG